MAIQWAVRGLVLAVCCQMGAASAAVVGASDTIDRFNSPSVAIKPTPLSISKAIQAGVISSLAIDTDYQINVTDDASTATDYAGLSQFSADAPAVQAPDLPWIEVPSDHWLRGGVMGLGSSQIDGTSAAPNFDWSETNDADALQTPHAIVPAAVPLPPALGVGLVTFALSLWVWQRKSRSH